MHFAICFVLLGAKAGGLMDENPQRTKIFKAHRCGVLPCAVLLCALLGSGCRHSRADLTTVPVPGSSVGQALKRQLPPSSGYRNRHKGDIRPATAWPGVNPRLLRKPSHRSCKFRQPSQSNGSVSLPKTLADPKLLEIVRLEFERDCYRKAERRIRRKLLRLQNAVRQLN